MNGAGEKRYSSNFEKVARKLKLLFPCALCGERSYSALEVHHIDHNKKNSSIDNLVVLCIDCHRKVHKGLEVKPQEEYKKAFRTKRIILEKQGHYKKDWINRNSRIELIELDSKTANKFRKENIKGFVNIGGCNIYIGMIIDNILQGVLGFKNSETGHHDIFMKADTTKSQDKYSTELLLYLMRTKEIKKILERKFNRNIRNIYTICHSKHKDISRYRKHGELKKSDETKRGFNVAYLFNTGELTKKAAIAQFFQKHKDIC